MRGKKDFGYGVTSYFSEMHFFLFSDLRPGIVSGGLILGHLTTIFYTFLISAMPRVPTTSLSKFNYSKNTWGRIKNYDAPANWKIEAA
jgi:hypothetical protein